MELKLRSLLGIVLCLVLVSMTWTSACAATDANPVFIGSQVVLARNLKAEIGAETKGPCEEITISSLYLQHVNSNGSKVYSSTRLSNPTSTFSDESNYYAWMDCSESATKGNYYRLKVIFNADGTSMTAYSNVAQYQ